MLSLDVVDVVIVVVVAVVTCHLAYKDGFWLLCYRQLEAQKLVEKQKYHFIRSWPADVMWQPDFQNGVCRLFELG